MSETVNYGLYVTDNTSETFANWREKMNGETDSNIVKIDAILGDKADNSIVVEAMLLASGWFGDAAPYTQEVAVAGLTEQHNGMISVSQSATAEQREMARTCALSVVGQADGSLTVSADIVKPGVDIPVCVILLG